jgi:thioredoxin-like negative regulator of GroEL
MVGERLFEPYGEASMVKNIEPQDFDLELRGGQPFLVAFLKKNERFRAQIRVLNDAESQHAGRLNCYLYAEDYLDTAMQRFTVKGTPTFLLFSGGREVDRLIGESDRETLDEFIRVSLGKSEA